MEPRLLLSADLLQLAGLPGLDLTRDDPPWTDLDELDAAAMPALADYSGSASTTVDHTAAAPGLPLTVRPDLEYPDTTQLVFVDTAVPEHVQLIEQILENTHDDEVLIYLLDGARGGVEQISEILAQHSGLAGVHLISHGAPGVLQFGADSLSPANLSEHAHVLAAWGEALAADADLLIYGCEVAATADGQAFIDELAVLTGADVAASIDATGSESLGGDWDLEYTQGTIQTSLGCTFDIQQNWRGLLGQINVTTTADILDGDADTSSLSALAATPGSDGFVSLREAIIAANTDIGADAILLDAATYTITTLGLDDNTGDYDIRDDLSIIGIVPGATSIDGNNISSVFDVHDDAAITVSFSNLKIQNGRSTAVFEEHGAGLYIEGSLNTPEVFLNDVWFSANNATFGTGSGGAIYNAGNLTIERALIENNHGEIGGAICNAASGVLRMTNVTLSGNYADVGAGGGLYNDGTVILRNATIADNDANTQGGGLFVAGGTLDIANSIVADNNGDLFGTLASSGGNIFKDDANAAGFDLSDQRNIDPNLGSLSNHGGNLMTYAPAATEAIDNADAALAAVIDQRGFLRDDGSPDIGAHEVGASTAPITSDLWLSPNRVVTGGGQTGDDTWNKSDLVGIGDPGLDLGPGTTAGTFSTVFDADAFASGWNLNAAHYVSAPIQVGNSSFQILAGDLLLSPDADETFTSNNAVALASGFSASLDATKDDLVVFRPDTPGDYSQGQFGMLIEDVAGGHELRGITLIEQTISVGGQTLEAGDFLYSRSGGGDDDDLWLYETGTTGIGASPDNRLVFLAGEDAGVGISNKINGVELLENTTQIGDQVLAAGTLLINVDNSEPVGSNGLIVDEFDVFALNVAVSSLAGPGQATASMLFDGSDVAFDSTDENLDAVVLVPNSLVVENDPVFHSDGPFSLDEHSAAGTTVGDIDADDGDGGSVDVGITYDITVNADTDGDSTKAFTIHPTTGVLTINDPDDLDFEGLNPLIITVEADDGVRTTSTAVSIDLNDINDAPSASNLSSTSSYNEGDATVALSDILVSDADAGETISATLTLADSGCGSLSANDGASYDSGSGVWTISDSVANVNTALANLVFQPNPDNDQDTTISVTIDDGDEDASGPLSGSISLDVTPVNDAPSIHSFAGYGVSEDDNYRTVPGISIDDIDAGGTDIQVTLGVNDGQLKIGSAVGLTSISGNDSGSVVLMGSLTDINEAMASLSYKPDPDYSGSDNLSISVNDLGSSGSGGPQVTNKNVPLTVSPVNDAPSASNLSSTSSYNEGDATVALSDILVSDADAGETISATLTLADSGRGSLSANDGASYDSGSGVWTISDSVANVNTALANLVFQPNPDNDQDTTISVTIDDGDEDASGPLSGSISLDVTPVNDEQVLTTNTGATVAEGSSGTTISNAMLATTDVDNPAGQLVYTLTGVPAKGTLYLSGTPLAVAQTFTQDDIDNDRIRYDHDGSETLSDSFSFAVDDGAGTSTSGSFHVSITPVNDNDPVADDESFSVVEGGTASEADLMMGASLLDGDSDADLPNDSLSVNTTPLAGPSHGSLTLNADGRFSYTHDGSENFSDSFSYVLQDADGGVTAIGTVTISISPVNDAPSASNLSSTSSYNEGDATVALSDILVSDADAGETISATLTLADSGRGSLSANDGASYDSGSGVWTISDSVANVNTALANLVFQPNPDNDQDTTISVTIDDGDEDASGPLSGSISLDVTPVNAAPTITSSALTTATEDSAYSYTFTGSDVDSGDSLTLSAPTLPVWLSFDPATGILSGTPSNAEVGPHTVVLRVNDGTVNVDQGFILTVANTNDAPAIVNNTLVLEQGQTIVLTPSILSSSDLDDSDASLILTVSNVSGGYFERLTAPGITISSFTQAELAAGLVVFVDDGDDLAPAYSITVTDGDLSLGPLPATIVFSLSSVVETNMPVPVPNSEPLPDSASDMVTMSVHEATTQQPVVAAPAEPMAWEPITVETETAAVTAKVAARDKAAETPAEDVIPDTPTQSDALPENELRDVGDRVIGSNWQAMLKNFLLRPTLPALMSIADPVLAESLELNNLATEIRSLLMSNDFNDDLDRLRQDMADMTLLHRAMVGSSVAVTTSLSVGYVAWLVRGGVLLSTVLSSLPAWQIIDPLPVLARTRDIPVDDDSDEDSLESIIQKRSAEAAKQSNETPAVRDVGGKLDGKLESSS